METPTEPGPGLVEALAFQAEWCPRLGSPLYGDLLEAAARDAASGGIVAEILADYTGDPPGSFPALRFMGAIHRLVLEGKAPNLARFYPSVGGREPREKAVGPFLQTVREHRDEIRQLAASGVQTNEAGRSAGLIGGFLTVARETGLPLRVLETGASAGLNLRWDHFRYEARGATWGPEDSPVRLCDFNSERPLPFGVGASVIERRGCDRAPIDPTTAEGRLTLMSYVWPDQTARFRLLKGALEVAARVPALVDEASAPTWLEERLAAPAIGCATVLFHSIFVQYMSDDERDRFFEVIATAGENAADEAPLAWLRMEPGGEVAHVRLTLWPGGEDRLIATAGYHGNAVRWLL